MPRPTGGSDSCLCAMMLRGIQFRVWYAPPFGMIPYGLENWTASPTAAYNAGSVSGTRFLSVGHLLDIFFREFSGKREPASR